MTVTVGGRDGPVIVTPPAMTRASLSRGHHCDSADRAGGLRVPGSGPVIRVMSHESRSSRRKLLVTCTYGDSDDDSDASLVALSGPRPLAACGRNGGHDLYRDTDSDQGTTVTRDKSPLIMMGPGLRPPGYRDSTGGPPVGRVPGRGCSAATLQPRPVLPGRGCSEHLYSVTVSDRGYLNCQ
jgi:hypothetical protein